MGYNDDCFGVEVAVSIYNMIDINVTSIRDEDIRLLFVTLFLLLLIISKYEGEIDTGSQCAQSEYQC